MSSEPRSRRFWLGLRDEARDDVDWRSGEETRWRMLLMREGIVNVVTSTFESLL